MELYGVVGKYRGLGEIRSEMRLDEDIGSKW